MRDGITFSLATLVLSVMPWNLPAEVQPQRQRREGGPEPANKIRWNSAPGGSVTPELRRQGLCDSCCTAWHRHRGERHSLPVLTNFSTSIGLSALSLIQRVQSICISPEVCKRYCPTVADVRLGCDLSWDASRVFHSDGRDGESYQRP